jgi:hypothetical protein
MMLEMLLPEYTRQLLENYQNVLSQVVSQLRWLHFDDAFRLVTRVGYLDDGWIRVRVDGGSALDINLLEILRELSWLFYNVAESNRLLDSLTGALSSRATDSLRVAVVSALPESPFNLAKVAGTALTGRDWSLDFARLQNLDVTLSALSRLNRWGRDVTPAWVHGDEVTAPAAGTALVSWTVPVGKTGYIYGFYISAGEGNDFKVNWTSSGVAYSRRIIFPGKGTLHFVDVIAINEGLPADGGTSVTITNVNAGSAGIVYQAALLVVAV